MIRDIRQTELYREVESVYRSVLQPGTGQISDASEIHVAPDGKHAAFTGVLYEHLEGAAATRICCIDLATGYTRVLTHGQGADRSPKYSPSGRHIAFLSDRLRAGDFQLHLLDYVTGTTRSVLVADGWVEYLHWSPDGRRILLGVAGHGADVAGSQGATRSKRLMKHQSGWEPIVETGDEGYRWRRLWIHDLAMGTLSPAGHPHENVWEAVWCGDDALAAIVSSDPSEGSWYGACLHHLDLRTGASRKMYAPRDQLGVLAGAPDGSRVAFVEAICSDRGVVAGDLRIIDIAADTVRSPSTHQVDVSSALWTSNWQLLIAGHRRFESVVSSCDATGNITTELWASSELSGSGRYLSVAPLSAAGDCALIGESYARAPEVALIQSGMYRTVRSFDSGYAGHSASIDEVRPVTWTASDGLQIDGWLLLPAARSSPPPIVMTLHGGPVSHWRPAWLGRPKGMSSLMLLKHGFAVFFPNPRGSAGRGRDFARRVVGDMGGADAGDCLAGLDHLVSRGLADPKRLGVTGGSYGGYLTSWLVTQDRRFAAAVASSPVTNHVTEHLTSNIPHFQQRFLADTYRNPDGTYFTRSPIRYARQVTTPTLSSCGALDRCTPPSEALQFHRALLESGVTSALVTYPQEGHGIRKFPATIDYVARVVGWFEQYMGAGIKPADDKGCESPTAKQ